MKNQMNLSDILKHNKIGTYYGRFSTDRIQDYQMPEGICSTSKFGETEDEE